MSDRTALQNAIARQLPRLIEFRHELHRFPELAYEEFKTAERVLAVLKTISALEIRSGIARTGIVATLGAEKPGPCVALRADMDALPLQELTGLPYASQKPGFMHACGHDGHTTCLLGAALVLSELRDELRGPVKFIFQPAEEAQGGAQRMCAEGALSNPNADAIFGLHGMPLAAQGEIAFRTGPLLASSDRFSMMVRGKGAHAAAPQLAIDPIVIGSQIVSALQTVISRSTNPLHAGVVSITTFHGGTAENIIPESVTLGGTIRALDEDTRTSLATSCEKIARGIAASFGAQIEWDYHRGYPVTINDASATSYFESVCQTSADISDVEPSIEPMMFAEDFSYYGEHVPACFWLLGLRNPGQREMPFLHSPYFDFNDAAIPLAVELHCQTALQFTDQWSER